MAARSSFSIFLLFLVLLLPGCANRTAAPVASEPTAAAAPTSAATPTSATAAPASNAPQACSDHYYYGQEKVTLTLVPQHALIGFNGSPTSAQKLEVLRKFPAFAGFPAETQQDGDGGFQVIALQPATTCNQARKFLKDLQQQDLIQFANPVFKSLPAVGSGHQFMGITPEVIVTLKPGQPETELQRLANLTNTKITDNLGENVYLLSATKEAKGNALEMANYFQEQPSVATAEPNFFVFGR